MLNCINFIFYAVHALFMKHDAYFYTQQQYFIICLRHLRHTNYILPRFFYSISLVRFIEVDMRCKFQRKMQLKVTSTYCGTRCIVANWDLSLFVSLVVLLQRHSDLRFKEKWPFYVFLNVPSKNTFYSKWYFCTLYYLYEYNKKMISLKNDRCDVLQ